MRTLFEKPSKSEREDGFFATFISLEKDIPTGNWKRSEAPDYLLENGNTKIGLEITSLTDSGLAAIRNAQDRAFVIARQKAIDRGLPVMEVRAKFRNECLRVDVASAADELVEIVSRNLPDLNDSKGHLLRDVRGRYYSTIKVTLGARGGRNWRDAQRWGRLHMNWVRQDPIEDLQSAIDEKNAKLTDYLTKTKCQQCWLLVGVDEWTAAEAVFFSEKALEHEFQSGFQRVYFLRNIEAKLVRLRLIVESGLSRVVPVDAKRTRHD